jgi:methylmalonyl-CoA mutase cobalamin-binding subunit
VSSNATRAEIARLEKVLGRRPKLLVGELGVEGHSDIAEQLALKARDAGFDVVYEGSRATAEQVVTSAVEEGVHAIGLATEGGAAAPVARVRARAVAAGLLGLPIVGAAAGSEPAGKLDGELEALLGDLVRLVAQPARG